MRFAISWAAKAQTRAYDKIKDILTEEETAIYKRGRNAKVGHNPKSATQGEYHIATGIEALFGYLYLTEQQDRLRDLEQILPSYFIRINKSTLANEHRIDRFDAVFSGGVDAVFRCGYREYVSRRCFAEIRRRYERR